MSICAHIRRDVLRSEVTRLRRWKAEASAVLSGWERVYDALGKPGPLGESKAKASEAEVLRLLSRVAELERNVPRQTP